MARKNTAATQFSMIPSVETASAVNNDAILSDLLDQLGDESMLEDIEGADFAADSEIVEETEAQPAVAAGAIDASTIEVSDELLDEIVAGAEQAEAKKAIYAEQDGQPVISDATPPETAATDEEPAKKRKGGKKKNAAEDGDAEPKAPKAPRPTSVTHAPGDLLVAKLGAKAADFLTLRLSDAELGEEGMKERRDAFIARMNDRDGIADKVREKMIMLLTWMDKGGNLNEVMRRTFVLMHKDGQLTSGDKGNLQLDLLAKPYSIGTARSQANQMFCAMPELGIFLKEKGRMVPNPDSALLPVINSMLGLA